MRSRHHLLALSLAAGLITLSCRPGNQHASPTEASEQLRERISFPARELDEETLQALWAAELQRAGEPSEDHELLSLWRTANVALATGGDPARIAEFEEALFTFAAANGADATMVQGHYAFIAFRDALDGVLAAARDASVSPDEWLEAHHDSPEATAYREACGDFLEFAERIGAIDERGTRLMDDVLLELVYRDKWTRSFLSLVDNNGAFYPAERGAYLTWRMESPTILTTGARLELLSTITSHYGTLPYSVDFARGVILAQGEQVASAVSALEAAVASDPEDTIAAEYLEALRSLSHD